MEIRCKFLSSINDNILKSETFTLFGTVECCSKPESYACYTFSRREYGECKTSNYMSPRYNPQLLVFPSYPAVGTGSSNSHFFLSSGFSVGH